MNMTSQMKKFGILIGLVSIVIGIIIAYNPVRTEVFLNTVVGVGLIVMGFVKLVDELMARKEMGHSWLQMLIPALIVILGIYVMITPFATIFTIAMIIAFLALTMAFDRFAVAMRRRKEGLPYGTTIIFGVIQLLFGCFMCWNAFATMVGVIIFIGIYLIVNGVMIAISSLYLKDF